MRGVSPPWARPAMAALLLSACAVAHPGAAGAPRAIERIPAPAVAFLPEEPPPATAAGEFTTDFSRHTVPFNEIISGGPPRDGINALDHPNFTSVAGADAWLRASEPVVLVRIDDDARAYPLQILMWHEIVNDTVGGIPVTITFCPLCNTAIAFERSVAGRVLDFGTTGRLRYSNQIIYDRQTETWWQQASGEGIAGQLAGCHLVFRPASIVSWAEFRSGFPGGKVLSRETGFNRFYGRNPYVGYDDVSAPPFMYTGPETPDAMPPLARVIALDLNGESVAYPYETLRKARVVDDKVGGVEVVVLWAPGTASAIDAGTVAGGRDVGAAAAYSRSIDGATHTFEFRENRIIDLESGSEWNVLGQAVNGSLAGRILTPVVAANHLWFSWAAFRPETRIYRSRP